MQRWATDPRYSHGFLVPLFALYLLWMRRDRLAGAAAWRPSWWGLLGVVGGLALNAAGTYLYLDWLKALSFPLCLAGLGVLMGGLPALRWFWPAAAFLLFMTPLPYRLEVALAHPLQRMATAASTYALQTLGFAAFAEGNVIRMGEVRLGVVEACSGLSMLMTFFALSTAVAILIRRTIWEKVLIVVSAAPIALVANLLRITVTGVLHKVAGHYVADLVFHDLAGWLMMPLALGLLWAELRLLDWIVVKRPAREEAAPLFDFAAPGPAPRSVRKPTKQPKSEAKSAGASAGGARVQCP
jgi:exosortase